MHCLEDFKDIGIKVVCKYACSFFVGITFDVIVWVSGFYRLRHTRTWGRHFLRASLSLLEGKWRVSHAAPALRSALWRANNAHLLDIRINSIKSDASLCFNASLPLAKPWRFLIWKYIYLNKLVLFSKSAVLCDLYTYFNQEYGFSLCQSHIYYSQMSTPRFIDTPAIANMYHLKYTTK